MDFKENAVKKIQAKDMDTIMAEGKNQTRSGVKRCERNTS
jgi:hypothetical protein